MKKQIDLYNGNDWEKVDISYLEGIADLENIKEVWEEFGNKLRVIYKNNQEVFYSKIHGTWGDPTVVN